MQDATPPAWWQTTRGSILLALLAAVPFCWPTIPWLNDVPAHVARFHIQQTIAESPDLARHFIFTWRPIPNLGVDMLVVPLSKLFGLLAAVRIVTAAIPVLTILGTFAIVRAAHGRITTISLFALPLSLAYPFQFGFLNSCLSVAVAFFMFAWWLRVAPGRRSVLAAVCAPVLIVTHAIGWGVFGVLVGGGTIAELYQGRADLTSAVRRLTCNTLPLLWPLAILLMWRGNSNNAIELWFDWRDFVIWSVSLLRDRWMLLDVFSTLAVVAAATLPIWRPREFHVVPPLLVPAVILISLALVMPNQLLGSMFSASRLIPIAIIVGIIAVKEVQPVRGWVAPLALALFCVRLVSLTISQIEAERTAEAQLAALRQLPRGARVIAFVLEPCERRWRLPRLWHLPSVATLRRDATVNDLFADPGQLLSLRNPVADRWTSLPSHAVSNPACPQAHWPVFRDVWVKVPWTRVDFLWVLGGGLDRVPVTYPIMPVFDNGHTQLYRVLRQPPRTGTINR